MTLGHKADVAVAGAMTKLRVRETPYGFQVETDCGCLGWFPVKLYEQRAVAEQAVLAAYAKEFAI
jgi:hypothetical protein